MTNLTETAARAICLAEGENPDSSHFAQHANPRVNASSERSAWQDYIPHSHAAIAALGGNMTAVRLAIQIRAESPTKEGGTAFDINNIEATALIAAVIEKARLDEREVCAKIAEEFAAKNNRAFTTAVKRSDLMRSINQHDLADIAKTTAFKVGAAELEATAIAAAIRSNHD